jgi:hypothetical protein
MPESEIVQFVGYMSTLRVDHFIEQWQEFANRYAEKSSAITLQQQLQTRSRFNFISKHKWPEGDFRFSFMGKRNSEYFPERSVKVAQIGGYMKMNDPEARVKPVYIVMSFLKHEERDLDFYRNAGPCTHQNEYAAFYESCLYGYVFEYHATEAMLPTLLTHLRQKPENETAAYQACTLAKEKTAKLARNK